MPHQGQYISATGVDGCNILIFDGERFAQMTAVCAKELHSISPEMAVKYLEAMKGVTVKMENCTATFDNQHHANPFR